MTAADLRAAVQYYRPLITEAAKAQGLEPVVVEAVVAQESSYQANAYRFEPAFWARYLAYHDDYKDRLPARVSASYGLMQIMYPTARELDPRLEDPEVLFVPAVNLRLGCVLLAKLAAWAATERDEALHLRRVLGAYNGGRGNWHAIAPQRYAAEVIARVESLRAMRVGGATLQA